MAGGHYAALFHRVVEQGKSRRGAVGAAGLKSHFLEYAGNAVADRGSGREGQIHDAEGHAETARGLLSHELAHARYAEGGALYGLGNLVKGPAPHLFERAVHDSGA